MSSLKDLASLIMIPSLYKDGRLDTVKPLGNSIIHPDATGNNDGTDGTTPAEGNFTFSRGSNLAATRVDVNGLIEKGRENLLLQSNQFDTTWGTTNSSVTSGQSGYDGSSDAWKLVANTTTGSHNVLQSFSVSGVRTISVYAKPSGYNYMLIYSSGYGGTFFDLVNGTTTNNIGTTPIDTTITSVGSGWYRCSIIVSSGTDVSIWPSPDGINYNYAGDNTSGILIQAAQLEQSMVATDYIETGASTAQAGILEDMPRLDYSGGASCPALLLEPQRSNLVYQSEYLGGWGAINCSVTANSITSPEGVTNSFKITENSAASTQHRVVLGSIGGSSATYTMSAYVKNSSGSRMAYIDMGVVTGHFNFSTETMYSASGTTNVEDAGDGWYRISLTSNSAVSVTACYVGLSVNNNETYSGDGSSAIEFYGVQLEAGSYPTSYIPTYGSSVTRSRDDMNEQISSLTSLEQGTFFIDFDRGLTTATTRDVSSDGFFYRSTGSFPSNTAIEVATDINGSARLALRLGSFQGIYSDNTLSRYKMLVKWEGTSVKAYVNGNLEYNSSIKWGDALAPLQYIGYNATFRKSVNQVLTFPTALTDSECIALTTL